MPLKKEKRVFLCIFHREITCEKYTCGANHRAEHFPGIRGLCRRNVKFMTNTELIQFDHLELNSACGDCIKA
jgi:hypothetical protein